MKRLVLFLVIVLLAGSSGVLIADDAAEKLPEGQARAIITVEGMTCGGCCAPVEMAAKKLDGVVNARADYEKGIATVTYEKDKVTVEKIVEAINDNSSFKASMPKNEGKNQRS